mgnify:CR=1 FL=1
MNQTTKPSCFKSIQMLILGACMMVSQADAASYLMITDLGSSAEMIRRGNVEGFSHGSNAIFENPAGLKHVNTISTSIFSTQIMKEVAYKNISIAYATNIGTFAVGYMDAGVDGIPITTEHDNGTIVATGQDFSYKNRVGKLAYQASVSDQLHLGVSAVGYMNEIYTYTGTGYSLDAGAIYEFSNLQASLFFRNLIPTSVKYSDSADPTYSASESLPLHVVMALSYSISDVDIMAQYKYDGVNTLMSAGLDFTPGLLWGILDLSAGYREFSALDKVKHTTTYGVGLNLFGLSLDYAYEKSDHFEYDAYNFASIGIDF